VSAISRSESAAQTPESATTVALKGICRATAPNQRRSARSAAAPEEEEAAVVRVVTTVARIHTFRATVPNRAKSARRRASTATKSDTSALTVLTSVANAVPTLAAPVGTDGPLWHRFGVMNEEFVFWDKILNFFFLI